MVACLQDQAGANGILKAFGLPEVPIYKDATVTPDMPQDIGSFSLRACQGHVGVPWTDMKMREDAPEGAILKAVVKVESKQRRMRGTGRPRNHKSYLEERPTQVQSLNHSTKRGN
tara:strand:- start:1392 stop:1736 length:345 start_codon:yes stop_codon:yes gene_type:complete